jgi:uncharacterized protein
VVTAPVSEVYLSAASDDDFVISGDFVDLAPLAREAIVLALPLAPLCRPDCLGLCVDCGADLNDGPCGC